MLCYLVTKSCPTILWPLNCSLPGFSVHGFSRQEYRSGLSFPYPGNLPNLGIKPASPALAGGLFIIEPPGKWLSSVIAFIALWRYTYVNLNEGEGHFSNTVNLIHLFSSASFWTCPILVLPEKVIVGLPLLIILLLSQFGVAAAAKSFQSCWTLWDPVDGSPSGSPILGILQARTVQWVAISFSNAWKWKVKVKLLSLARLLATPWTAAYQAPPSMGFSRQEYWSGVPLPSPQGSPNLICGKKTGENWV